MKYLTDGLSIWRDMSLLKHRSEHPRNGRTSDCKRDRTEILDYIAANGPCSRFDVELCCFQGRNAVLGHLAALHKAGQIERWHDSYRVVGCPKS
jgi:hypothetical protein